MSNYKIDKGVPVPLVRRSRHSEYPFHDMELGDSFLIPKDIPLFKSKVRTLRANLATWYNKKTNKTFVTRTVPEGLRVWRTK